MFRGKIVFVLTFLITKKLYILISLFEGKVIHFNKKLIFICCQVKIFYIVNKSQSLVWVTFKVTKLKSQKFSIIQWLWLINSVKKKKKKLMAFQLFLLLLLSHFCFTRVVVGPVITRSSLTIFETLYRIGLGCCPKISKYIFKA